jgi:hypothetical protein
MLLQNKYNIGVLTVNIEFMLLGMKWVERLTKDGLSPVSKTCHLKSFEDNSRPSSGRRSRGSRMNTAESLKTSKQSMSSSSLDKTDEQMKTKICKLLKIISNSLRL